MNKSQKAVKHLLVFCILLSLTAGCTSSRQVKGITFSSNTALVSSSLMAPGEASAPNQWQEPVAEIDQLISEHSDQPALVNHLRVRQAMILTVHQQNNLASARWKQVVFDELKTERDRGLYQHWPALVWWYKRALGGPLAQDEKIMADKYTKQLSESLKSVTDVDLGFYLGTVMTQIRLRLLNDSDVSSPEKKQKVNSEIINWLADYINLFTEDDKVWLNSDNRADLAGITKSDASKIADFRRRVSLSEMVQSYCELPVDLELNIPTNWQPQEWDWQKLCAEDL